MGERISRHIKFYGYMCCLCQLTALKSLFRLSYHRTEQLFSFCDCIFFFSGNKCIQSLSTIILSVWMWYMICSFRKFFDLMQDRISFSSFWYYFAVFQTETSERCKLKLKTREKKLDKMLALIFFFILVWEA